MARIRGRGRNHYRLDSRVLKAFGNSVPGPIEALFNVSQSTFQHQHDAAFWFALSPAAVARELNSIINLSELDEVVATANKHVKEATGRVSALVLLRNEARETVKEDQWANKAWKVYRRLERVASKRDATATQIDEIESLISQIEKVNDMGFSHSAQLKLTVQALAIAEKAKKAEEQAYRIDGILEGIMAARKQIKKSTEELRRLEVEYTNLMQKECPLCQQPVPSP